MFDWNCKTILETDASNYVSVEVLSQFDDEDILRPVVFFSKKHSVTESNYEIYDKKLLAIVQCFEEWWPELEGFSSSVKIITDHKNLEYFMSTKLLNQHQVCWSEYLSQFCFKICYRPGKQGTKSDALTRRSENLSKEGDKRLHHQSQTVLKHKNLDFDLPATLAVMWTQNQAQQEKVSELSADNLEPNSSPELMAAHEQNPERSFEELSLNPDKRSSEELPPNLEELFIQDYESDSFRTQVLKSLQEEAPKHKDISLAECSERDSRLYYWNCLYVSESNPLKLQLLQTCHDSSLVGHPGKVKTYETLAHYYYWPEMLEYVVQYVWNCHICVHTKASRKDYEGVLCPLSVSEQFWKDIFIDFKIQLPKSNDHDAILIIVDQLTKMKHIMVCHGICDAEEVAWLFVWHVWRLHDLFTTVISDQDTQFVSDFWKHLTKRLGIQSRLLIIYYSETDGQTENINMILEQYLCVYVGYLQDDWYEWLSLAEFAMNQTQFKTTHILLFFANYGFHPQMRFEPVPTEQKPATHDANDFALTMEAIVSHLHSEMMAAQARQEEYANRSRNPALRYWVGDLIWLNTKNIRTLRPKKKLDWKHIGPFPVTKVISPYSYCLELPATICIHSVFHVSLLHPAYQNHVSGQNSDPSPPIEVKDHNKWKVKEVVNFFWDHQGCKGHPQLKYLVKWAGYNEPTVSPAEYLENAQDAVHTFHCWYSNKLKPWSIHLDRAWYLGGE